MRDNILDFGCYCAELLRMLNVIDSALAAKSFPCFERIDSSWCR